MSLAAGRLDVWSGLTGCPGCAENWMFLRNAETGLSWAPGGDWDIWLARRGICDVPGEPRGD